jgi:hypothetical protein
MLHRLSRIIERAEAGDPESQAWVGFFNLTLICVVVIAIVMIIWIWI